VFKIAHGDKTDAAPCRSLCYGVACNTTTFTTRKLAGRQWLLTVS
jgi:hypothetical protein